MREAVYYCASAPVVCHNVSFYKNVLGLQWIMLRTMSKFQIFDSHINDKLQGLTTQ